MAMALTALLMAPAPIAGTSTRPVLRSTPAIAPATATGFEVAETLSTSTGARSAGIAGTPSNMFTVDSLDGCRPAGRRVNGNQYRIESHWSRRHHEPVRDPAQEALDDHLLVHPDAAVAGADHADVGHVRRPARQDAAVRGGDVRVGAHHGARPAVQVPTHGGLLRGGLGVHVAEHDLYVWVGGKDLIGGAERVVQWVEEDPADEVHDQDLVPRGVDDAPALARRRRRIVRGTQHVMQARQLAQELLLGEDVVAGGDHVRAGALELGRDLRGQAEAAGRVLAVEHRQVRAQPFLEARQDRLHPVAAGMADDIRDEEDAQLLAGHARSCRNVNASARSWSSGNAGS